MSVQINANGMRSGGIAGLLAGGFGLVGCLVTVGAAVLSVLCVGGMVYGFISVFRGSEPVQQAFEIAQDHPAVIEAVGSPVELGWLVMGQINSNNGSGFADVDAPISGPNGEAMLEIQATQVSGVWQVSSLHLSHGTDWIDLLDTP